MEQEYNWIDYGNLAIGIGTFLLAVVLGIATWVRANRDRRVHVADQRMIYRSQPIRVFQFLILMFSSAFFIGCSPLKPVSTLVNSSIEKYKYIYIPQTNSLTSGSGASVNGQYYSTSKSVNPRDVITGILTKKRIYTNS